MKTLFFGSRNATPKWLPVMRLCVRHACLISPPPLDEWLRMEEADRRKHVIMGMDFKLRFMHGDGPPGESKPGQRCPIGVDRLSEFSIVLDAPRHARVDRFPVEEKAGESWAQAAARRDREMADGKPDRAYCLHTNLDSSRGSALMARLLIARGIPFTYVRVTGAGALVDVTRR